MLFEPQFLICPACNPRSAHGSTSYGRSAFNVLDDDKYACPQHGHEFTLYESLACQIQGNVFSIIQAFAHYQWSTSKPYKPGELVRAALPSLPDFRPFATSATPANAPAHAQPAFFTDEDVVFTTSTIELGKDREFEGKPQLMIAVSFYSTQRSAGWVDVFYESLSDYLHHRYQLAIFKLASSAELWADDLFERYLRDTGKLEEKVITRIMSEQRSVWRTKFNRLKDLASIFLDDTHQKRFANSETAFQKFVREPRNDFAHKGTLIGRKHEDVGDAYKAAFDVLWTMDQLGKILP